MVEFKKTWYKFSKVGSDIFFQISDYDRSSDGFVTTAFTSEDDGHDVDYMYYGAYEGKYDLDDVLRSQSGVAPSTSRTFSGFNSIAKNKGSRYSIECFSKRWYILGLLMLVTRTRDIQAVIGYGVCGTNSNPNNTGLLNTNGLFYGRGSASNKGNAYSVKCFGIENMWGNIWKYMNGLYTGSSTALCIEGVAPYDKSNYTSVTDRYTRDSTLYPVDMIPVLNGAGMVASSGQSDHTKGFCDYWYVSSVSGYVSSVGGTRTDGWSFIGPFYFRVDYSSSSSVDTINARIIYA